MLTLALEIDVCFHLLVAAPVVARALGYGLTLEFQIEHMWKTITNGVYEGGCTIAFYAIYRMIPATSVPTHATSRQTVADFRTWLLLLQHDPQTFRSCCQRATRLPTSRRWWPHCAR